MKINRLGEKKTMNCGLEAEIIAYRNNKSIDVRLSDGTVKLNRMYKEFSKGQIGQCSTSLITRIGEKMLCIVAWKLKS